MQKKISSAFSLERKSNLRFKNNLVHMQLHVQAVKQCKAHTEARGGALTSKIKLTLAN